mgnify:CR=1 FL=1
MRIINLCDVTLRRCAMDKGFTLSFREKIDTAKMLDKLHVSVIELAPIVQDKIDSLLIKSIAGVVKNSVVAVPVELNPVSVERTWEALRSARQPRLQVRAPMSDAQMEYMLHLKPQAVIAAVGETVSACRALCADVEFVAEDATRGEGEFVKNAVAAAIAAGAGTVTFCDSAGIMMPDEFSRMISGIFQDIPELKTVTVGISCSDALGMANACAVQALREGAGEVKCSIAAAGVPSLSAMAEIISARGESCGISCSLRTTALRTTAAQIGRMVNTMRSCSSPFDNGVDNYEAGSMVLSSGDDAAAVGEAAVKLGYELSEEDKAKVFEAFKSVVSRKERITGKELDSIVASVAMQVPPTYTLESYVINSGNVITATAAVKLVRAGRTLSGFCTGDGPIDAAFLAIDQIVGTHFELDDFQIQAVTEGREAMGETVVKLRSGGKVYSGRGISTDIIGASVMAYISVVNKIVYEEDRI